LSAHRQKINHHGRLAAVVAEGAVYIGEPSTTLPRAREWPRASLPMIRITVHSQGGHRLEPAVSARFGESGGTIGRGDSATLLLADPERRISRTHATVEWRTGRWYLLDSGAGMPVVVNGRPVGRGLQVEIAPGDEIVIGDYVMGVEGEGGPGTRSRPEPVFDFTRPASGAVADPFAEFFAPVPPRVPERPPADPGGIPARGLNADSLRGDLDAAFHLGDAAAPGKTEDPFGPGHPLAPPAGAALFAGAAASDADPVANLFGPASPAPWPGVAGPDAMRSPSGLGLDEGAPRAERDQADDATQLSAAGTGEGTAASAFGGSSVQGTDPTALRDAFLEGAGMAHLDLAVFTPASMRMLGALLRACVSGTVELLAARTVTKQALRASMTEIGVKDNNPLKFASSVEAAFEHLLAPRSGGFLAPTEAIRDAYASLSTHQLASVAGARAALAAVLRQFDPVAIETQPGAPGALSGLLPGGRKARLWDRFVERHAAVSTAIEDDVRALFGEAFVAAYEAEVRALREHEVSVPG